MRSDLQQATHMLEHTGGAVHEQATLNQQLQEQMQQVSSQPVSAPAGSTPCVVWSAHSLPACRRPGQVAYVPDVLLCFAVFAVRVCTVAAAAVDDGGRAAQASSR